MRFFECAACKAKDSEIGHLREASKDEVSHLLAELTAKNDQIDTLTKRLTEIADPGIDRRLRQPRPIAGPLPGPIAPKPLDGVTLHDQPGANFPGYERGRTPAPRDYEVE